MGTSDTRKANPKLFWKSFNC